MLARGLENERKMKSQVLVREGEVLSLSIESGYREVKERIITEEQKNIFLKFGKSWIYNRIFF